MPDDQKTGFINILIAEDNDISREMMGSVLRTQGYRILGAEDGGEAIEIIQHQNVDLAFVDINMAPTGGFEFIKYLTVKGINVPVVIVTSDDSSDMLSAARSLGVAQILQKPVDPQRLIQVAQRTLKRSGVNPSPMGVVVHDTKYTHESLMKRAIEIAEQNALSKQGGPFGAVIADHDGHILGEGRNGITSRVDPTAHAEVMAIRQAAEKLGKSNLSECVLYVSSEPTMMGKALISSVGISQVYFGISHQEIAAMRIDDGGRDQTQIAAVEPLYTQIGKDEALKMFRAWQALDDKLHD
jgi:tRNA(Arg) A34 adenosine deaminase TadA/CheY-like chemotaxis protein